MNNNNFKFTPVVLLSLLLLAGCSGQQGTTRVDDPLAGPSGDMVDNTGNLGVQSQKGSGDIYVKLAVAYMSEGQLDVALQKARTAIDVEPNNADGHNVLGLLYERLGEFGLAERHFKKSIQLQPRNSYTLNAYASFLCQRGRYDEADKVYNDALANPLYRTPEVALTNAGICARRRPDMEQAERYLRQALARNPVFPSALFQMAQISLEDKEYLSGRGYLQRYQAVAAHTPASLWLGIQIERELGDKDAVASYSLTLRNRFPDAPEIQQLRELEQE